MHSDAVQTLRAPKSRAFDMVASAMVDARLRKTFDAQSRDELERALVLAEDMLAVRTAELESHRFAYEFAAEASR